MLVGTCYSIIHRFKITWIKINRYSRKLWLMIQKVALVMTKIWKVGKNSISQVFMILNMYAYLYSNISWIEKRHV